MTIAIENQQRLSGIINYDAHYMNSPHFTNPWHSTYPPNHQTPHHFVNNRQELLSNNRSVPNGYEQQYSTAPSPIQNTFSANQAPYEPLPYASSTIRSSYTVHQPDNTRRISQPLTYYGGYINSDMGDYTCNGLPRNNSEIIKGSSRTLPRPPAILTGGTSPISPAPIPPAPQSMMGQFSSKITSNTTKKHKCKVCDKRFTRPSSLQTHMYSHTGEKPFVCHMGGCGRQFSVVSNLRRHQKVHKNETRSEAGSEEHHSDG